MTRLIVLELNELNFDAVRSYAEQGALPNFRAFFQRHGYCETLSEVRYEELEPWIQWVTVHTGLSFAEHGIFRLGDAVASQTPQIWELVEREMNLTVGAISPMNAANRATRPAFFVPDPWTATPPSGTWLTRQLSAAIAQAVNDNARGRITTTTMATLVAGICRFASARNYERYVTLAARRTRRPWNRVLLLDMFLSDVFVTLMKKSRPHFATFFLNGAAHLQHHYMLNSPACRSARRNPPWYIRPDEDPVGDIYRTYDRILGQVQRVLPGWRTVLVTGLHQEPYPAPEFYWRLLDHADFLARLGLRFKEVQSRMSRDFVVGFENDEDLRRSADLLRSAKIGGEPAFSVEERKADIFVQLIFPHEITKDMSLAAGERVIGNLREHVVFVALKNGHHSGIGYFSDSGRTADDLEPSIPLAQVYHELLAILGRGKASVRREPAGASARRQPDTVS